MAQLRLQPDTLVRARFFHSLADPSRLAILEALRVGECSAGQLAAAAGLSRSNASRHLACLKDCGLVESRQSWRHVHYRLANGVTRLLEANDAFLVGVAEQVAACQRAEIGNES